MKKLLIFFIACIVFFFACSKSEKKESENSSKTKLSANSGQDIYTKYCKLCHGNDGKLGLSGATDLSSSVLTQEEKLHVITNGRKGMTAFKNQLTAEQIQLVSAYLETLKQ